MFSELNLNKSNILSMFVNCQATCKLLSTNAFNLCQILSFVNPFPNTKILDSSKLKEFADDNFKFDESDRMFSKQVENTVGKGEIPH